MSASSWCPFLVPWRSSAFGREGQVRGAARGRGRLDVEPLLEGLQAVPHADAATEHDRHLHQVHVVDQPCGDEVANDRGPTADPHVLPAGEPWTPLLALSTECPISWAGSSRARGRVAVGCLGVLPGDIDES